MEKREGGREGERDHLRPRMDTSNGSTAVEGGISGRVIGQIISPDLAYIIRQDLVKIFDVRNCACVCVCFFNRLDR